MVSGFTTHYLCCCVNYLPQKTILTPFMDDFSSPLLSSLSYAHHIYRKSIPLALVFLDLNHLFLNPSSATFSYGYTSDHVNLRKSSTWKPFLQSYSSSPISCILLTVVFKLFFDTTGSCNAVTLLPFHNPSSPSFLFLTSWGSTTQYRTHCKDLSFPDHSDITPAKKKSIGLIGTNCIPAIYLYLGSWTNWRNSPKTCLTLNLQPQNLNTNSKLLDKPITSLSSMCVHPKRSSHSGFLFLQSFIAAGPLLTQLRTLSHTSLTALLKFLLSNPSPYLWYI